MQARTKLPDHDPLSAFSDAVLCAGDSQPIPLSGTRHHVTLRGALAKVEAVREFSNTETDSIEVTMTMPVPVRATVYSLEVLVGERRLRGIAQPRVQARARYETAIDDGSLAVLHEEVMRGIHMISIAHLAPGVEVSVICKWVTTLVPSHGGLGLLRIPLTVGQIYGRSPLPDSDDLVTGGNKATGTLSIDAGGCDAVCNGKPVTEAPFEIPLNQPIDIIAPLPAETRLLGRAADGRRISLAIRPDPATGKEIAAAILVDHSGSMGSPCGDPGIALTKHEALLRGLETMSERFGRSDRIDLFEFDDTCEFLGSSTGERRPRNLVQRLNPPSGGTEIGSAIAFVLANSEMRDIVLVTDGQSHALNVAKLARSGRRFSVVLIGSDSLEAQVGHLAALTGGSLAVVSGARVADAFSLVTTALGSAYEPCEPIDGEIRQVRARRDALVLEAEWGSAETASDDGEITGAVSAFATSLALPLLSEEKAAALSAAEGLAGAFTSLVLVDEVGDKQAGLPATRKVRLPAPPPYHSVGQAFPGQTFAAPAFAPQACTAAAAPRARMSAPAEAAFPNAPRSSSPSVMDILKSKLKLPRPWLSPVDKGVTDTGKAAKPKKPRHQSGLALGAVLPNMALGFWDTQGDALSSGDIAGLPEDLIEILEALASRTDLKLEAEQLGLSPMLLVVGLIARRDARRSRHAARVERRIFKALSSDEVNAAALAVEALL